MTLICRRSAGKRPRPAEAWLDRRCLLAGYWRRPPDSVRRTLRMTAGGLRGDSTPVDWLGGCHRLEPDRDQGRSLYCPAIWALRLMLCGCGLHARRAKAGQRKESRNKKQHGELGETRMSISMFDLTLAGARLDMASLRYERHKPGGDISCWPPRHENETR
jgi:hypothetical protein